MRHHELACFAERSGQPEGAFEVHDLLEGPPSLHAARSYDAVMVGGSGDYYVSQNNLPHQEHFHGFLAELAQAGPPTFASCFGYQSMVLALGGEIIYDPERTEVGTYDLVLTDEGATDELFSSLPGTFLAQMGHKDRATRHPAGIPNLAASDRCPYQALRIPGRPVWAAQFHPELAMHSNRERFQAYLDGYAGYMSDEERVHALSRFKASPEASGLLERFIQLVFG